MKPNMLTRVGWYLILSGLILIGLFTLPPAGKQQQANIRLDKAIGWLDEAEKKSIEQTNGLAELTTCEIELEVKSPRVMRIGKDGQVSLAAMLICARPKDTNGLLQIRTKLTEVKNRVMPIGEISGNIQPGQYSQTYWSIVSETTGQMEGTMWVYLDIVDDTTKKVTIPVASIPITADITSVLGLNQSNLIQICVWMIIGGMVLLLIDRGSTRISMKKNLNQ